jgi:hypothetical protein
MRIYQQINLYFQLFHGGQPHYLLYFLKVILPLYRVERSAPNNMNHLCYLVSTDDKLR